jgi:hypothetical protein
MEGYCFKCREKREFNPIETMTYNTKKGVKTAKTGDCPVCKKKIFVMVKNDG